MRKSIKKAVAAPVVNKVHAKAVKHLQSAHKHLVKAQETLGDSHDVKPVAKAKGKPGRKKKVL